MLRVLACALILSASAAAHAAACPPVSHVDGPVQLEGAFGRLMLVGASADLSTVAAAAAKVKAPVIVRLVPAETAAGSLAKPISNGVPVMNIPLVRPQASSALFSFDAEDIRLASAQAGGVKFQVVARVDASTGSVIPLGALVQGPGVQSDMELIWFPSTMPPGPSSLHVQALERLYEIGLQQDPERQFIFRVAGQAKATRGASQASALEAIAAARNCASAAYLAQSDSPRLRAWQSVHLDVLPTRGKDGLHVGVRVSDADRRPVPASSISFVRGPHLACVVIASKNGEARCMLQDNHGHSAEEHDDDNAATVATFAGVVTAERVLLPTTAVWKSATPRK